MNELLDRLFQACAADLCRLAFMQRALLAAALVGVAAPAIGIFLVQRRLSLMGDGIGHVAFAGVAAGFLLRTSPVITAIAAAVLGAVALELLRERDRMAGDVALALIFYGGIAVGVLLINLADASTANLLGYLFGSIVSVNEHDVLITAAVATCVLAVTFGLRKELFVVCYDEEVARVAGLKARTLNLLMAITAAVTIAVTMRVVGILLVSAMLVLPVATVQQVTRSFRSTVLASLAMGTLVSVGGLVIAFYANVYPAATIVLTALGAFILTMLVARLRRAFQRP